MAVKIYRPLKNLYLSFQIHTKLCASLSMSCSLMTSLAQVHSSAESNLLCISTWDFVLFLQYLFQRSYVPRCPYLTTFVPQLEQWLIRIIILTMHYNNCLYHVFPPVHGRLPRFGVNMYHIIIHNGSGDYSGMYSEIEMLRKNIHNPTYLQWLDLHFFCPKWSRDKCYVSRIVSKISGSSECSSFSHRVLAS